MNVFGMMLDEGTHPSASPFPTLLSDITACNNKALCQTFNTDLDGAIQTLETACLLLPLSEISPRSLTHTRSHTHYRQLIKRDPLKNLHPRLVANLCTLYDTVGHGSKERK